MKRIDNLTDVMEELNLPEEDTVLAWMISHVAKRAGKNSNRKMKSL